LVYPLALPNVAYRKLVIPHISIPLTKNIVEQNLVGFQNLVYPHVGPYTPYFGSNYEGIKNDPTMWPPMSDPLVCPIALPKLVLIFA